MRSCVQLQRSRRWIRRQQGETESPTREAISEFASAVEDRLEARQAPLVLRAHEQPAEWRLETRLELESSPVVVSGCVPAVISLLEQTVRGDQPGVVWAVVECRLDEPIEHFGVERVLLLWPVQANVDDTPVSVDDQPVVHPRPPV